MNKFLKKMKKNEKGFTLIELIVVIAIIAILAAVTVPRFANFNKKAAMSAAEQEGASLAKILLAYNAEHGAFPDDVGILYYDTTDTANKKIVVDSDYGKFIISNVTGVATPTLTGSGNQKIAIAAGDLVYTQKVKSNDVTITIKFSTDNSVTGS